MAIYTTNIFADNSPATVGTGSFSTAGPSSVLYMGSTEIQLTDPSLGYAIYYGSFSYNYSEGSLCICLTTLVNSFIIYQTMYVSAYLQKSC